MLSVIGDARTVERAFRLIDIGLAEHGAHVLQADAAVRQRLRIELHAHGRLLLAADADETDAGDLSDLRQQDALRIGIDHGDRQRVGGQARAPGSACPPGSLSGWSADTACSAADTDSLH